MLEEKDLPKQRHNIMADMPNLPKPPLHPGTKQPAGPDDLKEKTILFNLSGHGYLDLQAYLDYLEGKLKDYEYPEEKIKEALSKLPVIK